MKVSLNMAKYVSNVDLVPNGIDDLVQKIGAQLGAVEEVETYGPRYNGIVVAEVMSCDKHPNADKLSVCLVNDGGITENVNRNENGYVQVVCGAPNVRQGLIVAWIPPGATVPATYDKDPFILKARELRGVVSNGMLASASELGIGSDHHGLLEITADDVGEELITPGTPFVSLYGLDDTIIDIENKMFTHRPDCFGVLGVAREIAGIYGNTFISPDWYLNVVDKSWNLEDSRLKLNVVNEVPELVPRFMAVAMDNVSIKQSPLWMQAGLTRVGIKPINNVVDVTNYLSYVTGQPLHAYDYDKVLDRSGDVASLIVRHPHDSETITLLNGKTVVPREKAIMIATEKELVGIGGVMGGADTEVDDNTKNIIIECANFDMYSIRRTSMAHGLFTDAVTRFNKGQSPLQNDRILLKAMALMTELSGAQQATNIIDTQHNLENNKSVVITADYINQRLGLQLDASAISTVLKNVEFEISTRDSELTITAPFWRTDIAIKEDIIEEVGRLLGFDKLEHQLPQRSVSPAKLDGKMELKKILRRQLASFGANEILTYSFVNGQLLKKAGQDPALAFKLSNALSPELQYFRMSLTPNLISHVHPNIKAGHNRLALFELNKTHVTLHKDDDDGVPTELDMVALTVADKSVKSNAFFQARAFLDALATELNIAVSYITMDQPLDYQVMKPFDYKRSALVKVRGTDITLGVIGEYTAETIKSMKLPAHAAGFELGLGYIQQAIDVREDIYAPLSRYPSISQDICLEVDENLPYEKLDDAADYALATHAESSWSINKELIDIYQNDTISGKKRITFRVTATSFSHTLTEEVVTTLLDQTADILAQQLSAVRI